MSVWSRLREIAARRRKPPDEPEQVTNLRFPVATYMLGRPQGPLDFDIRRLIDEGYRRNVVAYICINEIAQSVAAPKLKLRKRSTQAEVDKHPLLDLLNHPSPEQGRYELFESAIISQQAAGAAYLHKGRNGSGEVIQLRNLRPERMNPVPGPDGGIAAYEYKLEGQLKGQMVPREDVIALKLHDPLSDYHGLPPLMVCATFGDIDTEAAKYMRDFFINGAIPMGLLKLKVPNVKPAVKAATVREWQDTYGRPAEGAGALGRSNWHSIGVIGADVDYQKISAEPSELRLDAVWGMSETRICAAFGVPPSIVQVRIGLQYNTYSNAEQAMKSFWIETLTPMYRRIGDALSTQLAPEWDDDLEAYWDIESLPMFQESEDAKATRVVSLYKEGLISRNEGRKELRMEDDPTDYIVVPALAKTRDDFDDPKPPEPPSVTVLPPGNPADEKKPVPPQLQPGRPAPKQIGPGKPEPPPGGEQHLAALEMSPELLDDENALERHIHRPHIVSTGGKYKVVDDDGHVYGTHDTKPEAVRQVRALYAAKHVEARGHVEITGLGDIPFDSEELVQTKTPDLERAFLAAVDHAVRNSNPDALSEALRSNDRKGAEHALALDTFVEDYGLALRQHLLDVTLRAAKSHHEHHHRRESEGE